MIPIAITVENLAPFGGLLKQLPEAAPLLGKYPFLVFAIDDLLPMAELLPTGGDLMHYLEVRQAIAERKDLRMHDEMDHLGAYIQQNRADTIGSNMDDADMVLFTGGSDSIDQYFFELENEQLGGEPANPAPKQSFPSNVALTLELLETARPLAWLLANSYIRNMDGDTRLRVHKRLAVARQAACEGRQTAFHLPGPAGLSIAINAAASSWSDEQLRTKCQAAAIAFGIDRWVLIAISANNKGEMIAIKVFTSTRETPSPEVVEEAKNLSAQVDHAIAERLQTTKVGRNEPCPCGSGLKFKKCHGS